MKKRLDVDIAGAISEFQSIMKEFRLKRDIYKIIFRGKGLEFEAFRDYAPDDDASNIDWKASSRAQKLLVKQYKEERDMKIMFIIDVSNNMVFGSGKKLKCEFVAEVAAAMAKVIMDANDQVGFFFFSNKVKHFLDTRIGEKHFQLFVDMLTDAKNYGGVSNIDMALDYALDYFTPSINSVIFISDFLNVTKNTEKKLTLLSNKFETILLRVRDILDITLPDVDREIIVENPQTGDQVVVNPKVAKSSYENYAWQQSKIVEAMFKKSQADYLDLVTNKSFAEPLAVFLKERSEKGI